MSKIQNIVVALPIPGKNELTYAVPEALRARADVGARAVVNVGRRVLVGVIVDYPKEEYKGRIKNVIDLPDEAPPFDEIFLKFSSWVAEYYLAGIGDVLALALPPGKESKAIYKLVSVDVASRQSGMPHLGRNVIELLAEELEGLSLLQIEKRLGAKRTSLETTLRELEREGIVERTDELASVAARRKEFFVRLLPQENLSTTLDTLERKAPKQAQFLLALAKEQQSAPIPLTILLTTTGTTLAVAQGLAKKNIIELSEHESDGMPHVPTSPLALNDAQRNAIATAARSIDEKIFASYLLYGVTGSGKTEVYIELVKRARALGRTALVLVPEISLTPQLVDRFARHFSEPIGVIHSKRSVSERTQTWQRIVREEIGIVLGARSALFAPLKNIGVIIVDEEHDGSYKQQEQPRYHARDAAMMRAQLSQATVVLGSATPSIEMFYNAREGKVTLLTLPERATGALMPLLHVVDMRAQKFVPGVRRTISIELQRAIALRIEKKQGVILLQNRRGFTSVLVCRACGHVPQCVDCSVALTFHKSTKRLHCHYCGRTYKEETLCTACGASDIKEMGAGTERVEEELQELFPGASIDRMDHDATSRKGSHRAILKRFEDGVTDILVGTQMVAKGLDITRVTLVGVVNADIGLAVPNFRAGERTFQLLTQVSGRSGRAQGDRGEVYIQTYQPEHRAIADVIKHSYEEFFDRELAERREVHYPPFVRLASVEFQCARAEEALRAAQLFRKALPRDDKHVIVLGPAEAEIFKLRGMYRYHILLKSDASRLRHVLRSALGKIYVSRSVRIFIDIDPV